MSNLNTHELKQKKYELHLLEALATEDDDLIEKLFELGVDINKTYSDGETPLYKAVEQGSKNIVDKLIKLGVDINKSNELNSKISPLFAATIHNDMYFIKALLEANAEINLQNANGATPIFYAAKYGNSSVIKFLESKGANINKIMVDGSIPLFHAAIYGQDRAIETLHNLGVDVNQPNEKHGMCAIHYAAHKDHVEAIAKIVELGGEVDKICHNGFTALHFATQYGHVESIETLVECGANICHANPEGLTAFHFAAIQGNNHVMKTLLDFGMDVNFCSNDKFLTPMHAATKMGNHESIEFLFKNKAELNTKMYNGNNCLHIATNENHEKVVRTLINLGINIDDMNMNDETALNIAEKKKFKTIIKILKNSKKKTGTKAQKKSSKKKENVDTTECDEIRVCQPCK